MSIEKDVEKMYMKDIEKQNKNKKKKKKKRILTLLLIVVLLALLLLLMKYLGLGFGGGKGDGGSSANGTESSVSQTETSVTTTEAPKEPVNVQVSGSTYIYNGNVITIDSLYDTLRLMDNIVVVIRDDNATKNAMDELTSRLEAGGKAYTIEEPDDSSSANGSDSVAAVS